MLAGQKEIAVTGWSRGMTVGSANWQFTALSPRSGDLSGDRNEDSLVLLFSVWILPHAVYRRSGGSGGAAPGRTDGDGLADVLKVGHHGSANGSGEAFLAGYSRRRL